MPRLRVGRLVPRQPTTRPPLERCKWIVDRLRARRRLTADDVAQRFEISPRTAYRDMGFLRDRMQAPIVFDPGEESYVLTDKTYSLAVEEFPGKEIDGLFFAERVSRQYPGTPYQDDARHAIERLSRSVPEEVVAHWASLGDSLALDLGPVPVPDPAIFRTVVQCLVKRRRLLVRYHSLSSNRRSERRLDPYKLFNLRGTWYLAAHDDHRRSVRDFALHRIESAKPQSEPYAIDPAWSFEAYMKESFGIEKGGKPVRVAIRFAPRQARWIRERTWHRSASIQETVDGGCVLHLHVHGLGELKRWVLQFGSEAEVLKPASFRSEIARELDAARRRYARR